MGLVNKHNFWLLSNSPLTQYAKNVELIWKKTLHLNPGTNPKETTRQEPIFLDLKRKLHHG